MNAAVEPQRRLRGAGLLLAHCNALSETRGRSVPAFSRLEALVGRDLARLLVFALSGAGHGRRGSSSP